MAVFCVPLLLLTFPPPTHTHRFPAQTGFINFIVLPLWKSWSEFVTTDGEDVEQVKNSVSNMYEAQTCAVCFLKQSLALVALPTHHFFSLHSQPCAK